jgi:hypothetical protein
VCANRKPTPRQQKFIDYILKAGLTPAEAARQAGYAKNNAKYYDAHKAASVLMSKPHIAQVLMAGTVRQMKEGGKDWLLTQAITGVKKPFKKSQLDALRLAIRLVDREERKAEPKPSNSLRGLSDDALNSLIEKLGGSVQPAQLPTIGPEQTPTHLPNEPRENSKAGPSLLESQPVLPPVKKEDPSLAAEIKKGGTPQLPPERPQRDDTCTRVCSKHGNFTSIYKRHSYADGLLAWSGCDFCRREGEADLAWLSSLCPGG